MDFKKFFKTEKGKEGFKNTGKKIIHLWVDYRITVFITFLLIATIAGIYFWYRNLYWSNWSDQQRKEYIATQIREINLREEDFKKVIAEIERRKEEFRVPPQTVKDIFKPY
jgi:hypothetical protein